MGANYPDKVTISVGIIPTVNLHQKSNHAGFFQEVFVVHFVVNETDTQRHKNEHERCVQLLNRNHLSCLFFCQKAFFTLRLHITGIKYKYKFIIKIIVLKM